MNFLLFQNLQIDFLHFFIFTLNEILEPHVAVSKSVHVVTVFNTKNHSQDTLILKGQSGIYFCFFYQC